mgnify:CR=1 FL=1
MLVYQLKLLELGECLEPVFKTKENAQCFKEKYKTRNIIIKERYLENIKDDLVYRIKTLESDGYTLEEEVFSSIAEASKFLKNEHQSIVESRLYWWEVFTL